jgi:hypothetical protein
LFLPSKQGLQILIASIVLLSVCGEDVLPYHRVAQELSATFDRLRPADCGEEHCIWVLASIALNHSGNLLCCNLPPPCCKKTLRISSLLLELESQILRVPFSASVDTNTTSEAGSSFAILSSSSPTH